LIPVFQSVLTDILALVYSLAISQSCYDYFLPLEKMSQWVPHENKVIAQTVYRIPDQDIELRKDIQKIKIIITTSPKVIIDNKLD